MHRTCNADYAVSYPPPAPFFVTLAHR